MLTVPLITGVLAVMGGWAIAAQDKVHRESAEWTFVL